MYELVLSDELQSVLRQQGWAPERRISISNWVSQLVAEGITVLPEAEEILQNFGGLEITPVRTPTDAFAPETTRFDPVKEVLSEVERIMFWQGLLGRKVTPLGMQFPSECILLLCDDGQIVCEWGSILGEGGSTFADALENHLVFARRTPVNHTVDSQGKIVRL